MFFDVKSFSMKRNGRFAKCWLAATCPKQFRKFVNRAEVDNILVTNLCDNILQNVCGTSRQTTDRLSLHTAAQLTFGAVCIHQQQVHFLYEQISNLLAVRSLVLFDPIKRKRNYIKSHIASKRPRVESLASVVSSMILDFHESVINSEAVDVDSCDHLLAPIEAVTLRETISEHIVAADLEGFGVMTEEERMEFMYGDLDDDQRKCLNEQEAGMLIVMAEIHNPPPVDLPEIEEEILCSQQTNGDVSVPVYSYRSAANMNYDEICPYVSDQAMMDVEIPSAVETVGNNNGSLNQTIILSQSTIINNMSDANNRLNSDTRHPPNSKKRRLLIDPVTTLSIKGLFDQRSSQRCFSGLEETVELSEIYYSLNQGSRFIPTTHLLSVGRKSFKQLVRTDGNAQMSSVLFDTYRLRASQRHTQPLDEEWVLSICGELPKTDETRGKLLLPTVVDRISTRSNSNGEVSSTCLDLINLSINNVSSIINNDSPMASRSTFSNELPTFVDIDHQLENILKSLHLEETPMIENGDTIPSSSLYFKNYRELQYEWGKKGLLEKLIHLWRINTQPITMAVVTKVAKCDRRAAAFVFYTLMELNKLELVILQKVEDSCEIRHIEISTRLARSLKSLNA